ncbi:MAG: MBL fold metallo-hydrolase [Thermodesulfobacteriota bacterium]|nr:MBL fold metallo-hydrolase [Thermodesulfobacteriota bacterium]
MKITIVYDNEVFKGGLKADWGFSCLIEVENGRRILFDTGASGSILLHNLEKLNLDSRTIPEIFISHAHWDHTGGLLDLLKLNKEVKVYIPNSCPKPPGAGKVISITGPVQIHENVFSTGEIEGIEQSLVVRTREGLVVVTGCSHPGVRAILQAAASFGKVDALIGGLHGFRELDLLRDLKLVCPCHCTQFKSEIRRLYPEKCLDCGVGKVLEI